jgi:hypothetical protein
VVTPLEALESLLDGLRAVPGLGVATGDNPRSLVLPAVAVGIPRLEWETFREDPSTATFPVTLLVKLDSRAIVALLGFIEDVANAVGDVGAAVTGEAVPVSYDLEAGVTAAGVELTVVYAL